MQQAQSQSYAFRKQSEFTCPYQFWDDLHSTLEKPYSWLISSEPKHFPKLQIWITDFPNERLSVKTLKSWFKEHTSVISTNNKQSVQIISYFYF